LNTDVRRYEGLVRATANRIAPFVEMPLEDIEQRLRIKVWRALVTFDSAIGRPEDQYVLSCVFNEKKDILALRRRGELPLDAMLTPEDRKRNRGDAFEEQYLSVAAEQVYASIEEDDLTLPSTLSHLELRVVTRLYAQRYQTEIALELGLSKGEMEKAMRSIRAKLADWRPSASERGCALLPPLRRREQHQARRVA
jgi:DNA-directed RNA polymerase specialized sigma24 family protein